MKYRKIGVLQERKTQKMRNQEIEKLKKSAEKIEKNDTKKTEKTDMRKTIDLEKMDMVTWFFISGMESERKERNKTYRMYYVESWQKGNGKQKSKGNE